MNGAQLFGRREFGQMGVKHVRPRCLDDHASVFEPKAEDLIVRQELARQLPGVFSFDEDGVRMLINQIANLVNVALRQDAALIDQQNV